MDRFPRSFINRSLICLQAHDLEQWASQLKKELVCEITEHDDSSIEMMKKRHADIKVEMDAKEGLISSVIDIGLTKNSNKRSANNYVSILTLIEYFEKLRNC